MSTRLKISSNVTSFRKSQSRAGHSLELTIGIKKSKLVLAFQNLVGHQISQDVIADAASSHS